MRVKWLRNKSYIVTVLMEAYVNTNVRVVYCAYKYRVDAYSENHSSCTLTLRELGHCFSTVDG